MKNSAEIIKARLVADKFALLSGEDVVIPANLESEGARFFGEWQDLELDRYLRGGARFRRRRFAWFFFDAADERISRHPVETYFQPSGLNSYGGGIDRSFAPISQASGESPFLHHLIRFDFRQLPIPEERQAQRWTVDVHQIRVEVNSDEEGLPTPEGMHRDGDDYVCAHLIARENVLGGESSVSDDDGKVLARTTLSKPLDTLVVWDPFVLHGVTPIMPRERGMPALRDMLLIGFHRRILPPSEHGGLG